MPVAVVDSSGCFPTRKNAHVIDSQTAALKLSNISKSFNGIAALNAVDFELASGEVHALLGENGAGKSTLIKVMTGAYRLDEGTIDLYGKRITPRSTADAIALGISTVYQEVNLLPNLSVAHNLYLGREPTRFGCIDWKRLARDARKLLRRFRLDIDVTQSLASYSLAVQQLVAIARGIDCSARILILDEPTASLDAGEVEILFSILRELKSQSISVIFISHFLDQVYAIADRITVLRNGENVGTFATANLPRSSLVAHMLGRPLPEMQHEKRDSANDSSAPQFLSLSKLSAGNGIHDVSFSVARGETLGLAGLLGSGRTELCATLFGLAPATGGEIRFDGALCRIDGPPSAIRNAIALCPENRKAEGIIGPLSLCENIVLAVQARRGWWKPLSRRESLAMAERAVAALGIACAHVDRPINELSGGNQQKAILARWLATQPQLLILDEPTRGIDIGAHAEIVALIRDLCRQGMTLLVASSEIEELVAFSDKVIVMRDCSTQCELAGADVSEQTILTAIAHAE